MEEQLSDSGVFQTNRSTRQRNFVGQFFRYLVVFLLFVLLPTAYVGWKNFYAYFLEKVSPQIRLEKPPVGVSAQPLTFQISLEDTQSGLDEVIVRLQQGPQLEEVLRKRYGQRTNKDVISVTIDGKERGLIEGEVKISIAAFDKSFWSNVERLSLEIPVDYTPPAIELITTQHNAVLGGVQLVFYRVIQEEDIFSGITVGPQLFPGFPARLLDADFAETPEVYFAFFAVPLSFSSQRDQIYLLARDRVGNTKTEGVPCRIRDLFIPSIERKLREEFLSGRVNELFERFVEAKQALAGGSGRVLDGSASSEVLLRRFRAVNEEYRAVEQRELRTLFARPKAKRYWFGSFARMPFWREKPGFGGDIRYTWRGVDAGTESEYGIFFRGQAGSQVRVLNNGVVVFADELGLYGKTVIVDHGFGLSTLYGHLGAISCTEGDILEKGEVLGAMGDTGFIDGAGLAYEVRMQGVPVRPEEWWDERWIRDHIENRISDVKRRQGLQVRKPLL